MNKIWKDGDFEWPEEFHLKVNGLKYILKNNEYYKCYDKMNMIVHLNKSDVLLWINEPDAFLHLPDIGKQFLEIVKINKFNKEMKELASGD